MLPIWWFCSKAPTEVEFFCLDPSLSPSFYSSCYWLKLHPRKMGSQRMKLPSKCLFSKKSPNPGVHPVQSCFFLPPPGPGVWNRHLHCPKEPGAKHRVHCHPRACLPWDGGKITIRKWENKWVQISLWSDLCNLDLQRRIMLSQNFFWWMGTEKE